MVGSGYLTWGMIFSKRGGKGGKKGGEKERGGGRGGAKKMEGNLNCGSVKI